MQLEQGLDIPVERSFFPTAGASVISSIHLFYSSTSRPIGSVYSTCNPQNFQKCSTLPYLSVKFRRGKRRKSRRGGCRRRDRFHKEISQSVSRTCRRILQFLRRNIYKHGGWTRDMEDAEGFGTVENVDTRRGPRESSSFA